MIGPDGNGEQPDKTVGAVFATEGVTLEVYTLAMVSRVFWPVCVAASRCFGADGPRHHDSRFGSGYGMVAGLQESV